MNRREEHALTAKCLALQAQKLVGLHLSVPNFAAFSSAFLAGTIKSRGMIRASDA
jgi:hypothetical protein